MTIPTNLTEAKALLTPTTEDRVTSQDVKDVTEWLATGATLAANMLNAATASATASTLFLRDGNANGALRRLTLVGISEPAGVPGADSAYVYFDSSTNSLSTKDDAGNVTKFAGDFVSVSFEVPLTLNVNGLVDADGSGAAVVALAASGHVAGTRTIVLIPAYSRDDLRTPEDVTVEGDAFDQTGPYILELIVAGSEVVATGRALPLPDTLPPTLLAAHVTTADQDVLRLDFDKRVYVASLVGLTLAFTTGTPRTVVSVKSGSGTTTILLQLSGALADSDVCTLSVAAGAIQSMRSVALDAMIGIAVGWYMVPSELPDLTFWRDQTLVPFQESSGQWPRAGGTDSLVYQQALVNLHPNETLYDNSDQLELGTLLPYNVTGSNSGGDLLISADTHNVVNGQELTFYADPGATIFGGVTQGLSVWSRDATSTTFKLSLTDGGSTIAYSSSGSGSIKGRKVASLVPSGTFADLVTTAEDCWWTVGRLLEARPFLGTSNNPGIWGHGYRGVGLYSTGDDAWTAETWCREGAPGYAFRVANVPVQLRTPNLMRSRRDGAFVYGRKDYKTEIVGESCVEVGSLASTFALARAQPNGAFLPQSHALMIVIDDTPTAKESAGIDGYLRVHPACGFLRPRLRLPPTIWITVGRTGRLQWASIVLAGDLSQFTYSSTGVGTTTSAGWSFAPGAGDVGATTLVVKVSLGGAVVAWQSCTVVVSAAMATGIRKVLSIGDSNTQRQDGWVETMRANLSADGFTVTMLGTRGGRTFVGSASANTLDVSVGGANPYQNDDFVFMRADTSTGGNSLPAGCPASAYVVNRTSTTIQLSATQGGSVIDLTTDGVGTNYVKRANESHEGRAGWEWDEFYVSGQSPEESPFVFDGAFDFAAYCALIGDTPTHTVCMLGTNDLTMNPPYFEDDSLFVSYIEQDVILAAERIAQAVIAQGSKFLQMFTPPGNILQSTWTATSTPSWWAWRRAQHRLNERLFRQFRNRTAEGIYLVTSQAIDPAADFLVGNSLHWSASGDVRLGEAVAAAVRALP